MSIPNIVGLDFSGAQGDVAPESTFERFFDVGIHDVTILEATQFVPQSMEGRDPNWLTFQLKLGKDGYKPTTAFVDIPINLQGYEAYNGQTIMAGRKRRDLTVFIESLGVAESVTKENLGKLIGVLFSNPQKMVGLHLVIEMSHKYAHAYAKYVGRNEYHLVDPEGATVTTDEGVVAVFGHHNDCAARAVSEGWKYSKFPRVGKYTRSAIVNDFKKLGGTKPAAAIAGLEE